MLYVFSTQSVVTPDNVLNCHGSIGMMRPAHKAAPVIACDLTNFNDNSPVATPGDRPRTIFFGPTCAPLASS